MLKSTIVFLSLSLALTLEWGRALWVDLYVKASFQLLLVVYMGEGWIQRAEDYYNFGIFEHRAMSWETSHVIKLKSVLIFKTLDTCRQITF